MVGLMRPLTPSLTSSLSLRLRLFFSSFASFMSASGIRYCKPDANSDTDPTSKVMSNLGTTRFEMKQAKVEKQDDQT